MSEAPKTDPRPLYPDPASGSSPEALRELRHFHFDPMAHFESLAAEPAALEGLVPAFLAAEEGSTSSYPLFLGPPEAGEGAFYVSLSDLFLRAAPPEESSAPLVERLGDFEARVRRRLEGEAGPVDAREVFESVAKELRDEAGDGLAAPLERFLAAVPAGGRLLPWGEHAAFHLLRHAVASRLEPARAAFREEVRTLVERARAAVGQRQAAAKESEGLGALGSLFVDSEALDEVVGNESEEKAAPGELAEALEVLEGFLGEEKSAELVLLRAPDVFPALEATEAEDPCAAAADRFDSLAAGAAEVLRAVYRLRLELDGDYEPTRHEPWLTALDWQAFSSEELLLLVPVVALTTADRVAAGGMASLSRLLLSGRPVQVVVAIDPAAQPGAGEDPLSGYRFEPSYLGLSHREALVCQSSAARPAHLLQGFSRALAATHAGLHVLSSEPSSAAIDARAHPLFHYDPEAGRHWAERFDFRHNPQPEADWPVRRLAARKSGGGEEAVELACTFADYALTKPPYARHFRPVPEGVGEGALEPLASWSAAEEPPTTVPWIWALDGENKLVKLAVSRPLALAARDRLDYWRTLEELAGVSNEYARRAAEVAREEAEARARDERESLERFYTEEMERLRRQAAEEVADRLTAALLGGEVDFAELAQAPAPTFAPAAGTPALAGQSVEEVTAALLALVDRESLESEPAGNHGGQSAELASRLLGLVEGV